MKNITILGVTGSIGMQGLKVIDNNPGMFNIYGVSANNDVQKLIEIAHKYKPKYAVIANEKLHTELKVALEGTGIIALSGMEAINEIVSCNEIDIVLTGLVGSVGLIPLVKALKAGKTIALANKEPIVMAGSIIMETAKKHNAKIIPVDSEPSAIYQALRGEDTAKIEKIILTASGGALKHLNLDELSNVTVKQALDHPTWKMGDKITIDSATLINKGFEVIEAHHLFDIEYNKIEVIIHPESIVHSMVEFTDGAIIAQLGIPTMTTPIQYALFDGERSKVSFGKLDLVKSGKLTFSAPDFNKFPALSLAIKAGTEGRNRTTVLNAANSFAVDKFLKEQISFTDIAKITETALDNIEMDDCNSIEKVLYYDEMTTKKLKERIK